MPRKPSAALATDATAPTDIIPYDDAVREGQKILEDAERGWFRLGELADKIKPDYGNHTQAKFAAALGIAPCTLKRYLTVYRACKEKGIGAPGPQSSYAVLRELATHPDLAKIIEKNPGMTKREAVERMRQHNGKAEEAKGAKQKANGGQADEWSRNNKRWQADGIVIADNAIEWAEVRKRCTPEQRRKLVAVLEPDLIEIVRQASEALAALGEWLDELVDEGADTKIREGGLKTAPVPASVHAEA